MANTDSILHDIRTIIETGRRAAYEAVGQTAIATYWNIGRRIVEEEQDGRERAKFGTQLIKNIAETLVPLYGSNYSKRNLDYYKKFYLLFQDFEIVNTRVHNLDWSHIRRVLSAPGEEAGTWSSKSGILQTTLLNIHRFGDFAHACAKSDIATTTNH